MYCESAKGCVDYLAAWRSASRLQLLPVDDAVC